MYIKWSKKQLRPEAETLPLELEEGPCSRPQLFVIFKGITLLYLPMSSVDSNRLWGTFNLFENYLKETPGLLFSEFLLVPGLLCSIDWPTGWRPKYRKLKLTLFSQYN